MTYRSSFYLFQAGITLKNLDNDTEKTLTEAELFSALSDIYAFCFLDIESGQILKTKKRVAAAIGQIMDHIKANVGGGVFKRVCSIAGFL